LESRTGLFQGCITFVDCDTAFPQTSAKAVVNTCLEVQKMIASVPPAIAYMQPGQTVTMDYWVTIGRKKLQMWYHMTFEDVTEDGRVVLKRIPENGDQPNPVGSEDGSGCSDCESDYEDANSGAETNTQSGRSVGTNKTGSLTGEKNNR